MNIVICDDEKDRARRWKERLLALPSVSAAFEVRALEVNEFHAAIRDMQRRQRAARGDDTTRDAQADNAIDTADVLIVDFDLIGLQVPNSTSGAEALGPSETGERIAYLARCYSRCRTIVALNQFTAVTSFDLRLTGHPQSYADLNVASDQLANPGLWADQWEDFRPWSWPCLLESPTRQRQREADLAQEPNRRVLDVVGLGDPDLLLHMSRTQLEFLSLAERPEATTVKQFVYESGNGLRGKDQPWEWEAEARIAAARLHKWLERLVLPGQDILVDAPHLATRFPSQLAGDPERFESWDATSPVCGTGTAPGLLPELLDAHAHQPRHWLSRPAWLWPTLRNRTELPEVQDPWGARTAPFVFCEDISRFRPEGQAREFSADLISPYTRRFVAWDSEGGNSLPRSVRYEPAVRFAL